MEKENIHEKLEETSTSKNNINKSENEVEKEKDYKLEIMVNDAFNDKKWLSNWSNPVEMVQSLNKILESSSETREILAKALQENAEYAISDERLKELSK